MNDRNSNLEKEFLEYLDYIFGMNFSSAIQEPKGYSVGERVLYKLYHPVEAKRKSHEFNEKNVKGMLHGITGKSCGFSSIDIQPPITTTNIEARLVDFPDCDIMFDIPLMKYFQSDELLPHPEFNIEWLTGVFFSHSAKKLVNIDMLHPSVIGIFSVEYEIEMDLSIDPGRIAEYFSDYNYRLNSLREEFERDGTNTEWIKLIQLENNLMFKMRKK